MTQSALLNKHGQILLLNRFDNVSFCPISILFQLSARAVQYPLIVEYIFPTGKGEAEILLFVVEAC